MTTALREDTNVNSRGPTILLWIKQVFGFCGELWLSFRLLGDWDWFCLGIMGGDEGESCVFLARNMSTICGESVVFVWILLVGNDGSDSSECFLFEGPTVTTWDGCSRGPG